MPEIDFRRLLKRYMAEVTWQEGMHYVPARPDADLARRGITEEERQELLVILAEVRAEAKAARRA